MSENNIIEKAIEYCRELIDKYDNNRDIDDIDISHLIEILKGRKWGMNMDYHEVISNKFIETIGDYGIYKVKERPIDDNGFPYGHIQVWYDIAVERGDGDIVASFKTLKAARKWVKEN